MVRLGRKLEPVSGFGGRETFDVPELDDFALPRCSDRQQPRGASAIKCR